MLHPSSAWDCLARKSSMSQAPPRRSAAGQSSCAAGPCRNCHAPSSNSWSRRSRCAARIGLPALLGAARSLLKDNFLLVEDLQRLTQTMSGLAARSATKMSVLDTMEAVSVSLLRAGCVKLAVALKDHVADDDTLQAWIDEAKTDPLPEVRFSLIEPSQDDPE